MTITHEPVAARVEPGPRLAARPPGRLSRDVAGAFTWLTTLAVLALWVAAGGAQQLVSGDAGAALTEAGRLAGLLGAELLLVQVLLMARIPFVEQAYGQDELTRRHRVVGFTSFWLMIGHIVLTLWGYAESAGRSLLGMTWNVVVDYPGMLLAVAGTLALVMVVVTSVRRARAKLRYESWHLLHLYAYLGAGLAVPHMVWTGRDLMSGAAQVYWWSLWAFALGAVLLFRVALPLGRSLHHAVRVEAVVPEAPGVVSVHLRGRRLDTLGARAGQFFQWRFLDGPRWPQANPFSLSAAPGSDRMRITVKDLGDGSSRIASLKPGTRVLFEGPYGHMTSRLRTRRKVTLIASGVGITPLRALLDELPAKPGDVTLLHRTRGHDDVVFKDELTALAARGHVRVVHLPGPRRPGGPTWLPATAGSLSDSAALRRLVPDIAGHDVFICGPDAWADAAGKAAEGAGVPRSRIHLERFTW